ncbi:uncharacterized protein DUF4276 [Dysgonomonas alginatilytica]|uniref:Uncharacterized protein DUF4276 n=1 Tax=Dysgonomonas alginatilytica TaxID=1605892 RepID=A0A2V3PVW5_9BACT|nr:DUF4276 family protein [Dysgonomonas alginatilytica]PXV69272.1 uncharacterized protein DUF4276 [Dysgonomonas alginatilytica]
MVTTKEVTLFVEGGAFENDNTSTQTVDNTLALREAFYNLFSDLGIRNVSLKIEMSAGYKNALKRFLNKEDVHKFLLLDLDKPESQKEEWFKEASAETSIDSTKLNDQKDQIFFMIQAMEAWILSQPDAIENWAKDKKYLRVKADKPISDDNNLKDKQPQDILHPDKALGVITARYFEKSKGKKAKYGKLSSAPDLLNKLDRIKLKSDFIDVEALSNKLKA